MQDGFVLLFLRESCGEEKASCNEQGYTYRSQGGEEGEEEIVEKVTDACGWNGGKEQEKEGSYLRVVDVVLWPCTESSKACYKCYEFLTDKGKERDDCPHVEHDISEDLGLLKAE